MSHWKRIMNEDNAFVINTKNAQNTKKKFLATQMKHDRSSYFCRGPDDFCWGPAPVGPTLVTGLSANNKHVHKLVYTAPNRETSLRHWHTG